jgi:hypothetical protein
MFDKWRHGSVAKPPVGMAAIFIPKKLFFCNKTGFKEF